MYVSEIVIREVTDRARPAAYGQMDLGAKESQTRDTAKAQLRRGIPGHPDKIMCVTIVPDTAHNRVMILDKMKKPNRKIWAFVRQPDGKMDPLTETLGAQDLFGDLDNLDLGEGGGMRLPPGASTDRHDTADQDDPITVALGAGLNPEPPEIQANARVVTQEVLADREAKRGNAALAAARAAKAAKAAAQKAPETQEAAKPIRGVEDVAQLSMRQQMELVNHPQTPVKLLEEIAMFNGTDRLPATAIEAEVREAAFAKVSAASGG